MTETEQRPGGDYDQLPYVSLPITYSQPERLAAMAALYGLEAAPANTARVLEIGAASGGNIIPLAVRFPKAHFTGIDLAVRHIEVARRRIDELGLSNVDMVQADICDAAFGDRRFDYIVCHGVLSWVPPEARRAILRVCRDTLAPDGIAAISYNLLPGWHLRSVVRDIALGHAGAGTARERVSRVREILAQLTSQNGSIYGRLLDEEARRLATRPASYILGELLAEHNQPFHVREVVGLAGEHGLSYLCEADLGASLPALVAPRAAEEIRKLAGGNPLAVEQYADVFSGRTFRRSVLVRAGRVSRTPQPHRLQSLHLASEVCADGGTLKDGLGRAILGEKGDPGVRAALIDLGRSYPSTRPAAELLAAAPGEAARKALVTALMRLVASGRATVSSLASRVGTETLPEPHVWRLARIEAASGQPWVTSLQHAPVLLDPVLKVLLPRMDGRTGRAALGETLIQAVQSGAIAAAALEGGSADHGAEVTADHVSDAVARAIETSARKALLVADPALPK